MKTIQKLMILMGIIIICLGFAACTVKKEEANKDVVDEEGQQTQAPESKAPESQAPNGEAAPEAITYDIEGKNWSVEGITVKYPMIVNSNIQEKTDEANDLTMKDMDQLIETIKSNIDDKTLTIDAIFDYSRISQTALSINYLGEYNANSLAHPVSFYHSITISLDEVAVIPLSDLFVIDVAFIEGFKMWMYAPYRDDLNLEESGVNLIDLISEQYSNEALIKLFSKQNTEYYLSNQGLILSIGVPHVFGDHLEMAMNYEFLEANMKKDHPLWKDYMYLGGDELEGTVDSFDEFIKVGDIFTTTLDENTSTGYSWQYEIGDEEIIGFESDRVLEDSSTNNDELAIVGAASQHEWNFKGLKKGTTSVVFKYFRSWEGVETAENSLTYFITVE